MLKLGVEEWLVLAVMYTGAETVVRTVYGNSKFFKIKVGMYQGSPATYTPVQRPFSRITWVSRYQKGKTDLDFTEARDSEWQWHQLGPMQLCTQSRQITMPAPHHSVFYRPDALPAAEPTRSGH